MIRNLAIGSEYVQIVDTSPLERMLSEIERNPTFVREVQGSLILTFPDYEEAEVVFLVPEVRRYLQKIHSKIGHLWYYLEPTRDLGNMLIFLACHATVDQIQVLNNQVGVRVDDNLLRTLTNRIALTKRFAERMADDPKPVIAKILAPLESEARNRILEDIDLPAHLVNSHDQEI